MAAVSLISHVKQQNIRFQQIGLGLGLRVAAMGVGCVRGR